MEQGLRTKREGRKFLQGTGSLTECTNTPVSTEEKKQMSDDEDSRQIHQDFETSTSKSIHILQHEVVHTCDLPGKMGKRQTRP